MFYVFLVGNFQLNKIHIYRWRHVQWAAYYGPYLLNDQHRLGMSRELFLGDEMLRNKFQGVEGLYSKWTMFFYSKRMLMLAEFSSQQISIVGMRFLFLSILVIVLNLKRILGNPSNEQNKNLLPIQIFKSYHLVFASFVIFLVSLHLKHQ